MNTWQKHFHIGLAAATLGVHTASGVILYTDVFPDLTASTVRCDLNNDGDVEFRLEVRADSGGYQGSVWEPGLGLGSNIGVSVPERPNPYTVERLAVGEPIGFHAYSAPGAYFYLFDEFRPGGDFEWSIGARGYLGLHIYSYAENNHYFGWAEVSIDAVSGGPNAFAHTLYAYALEETPNTPIIAGAVPEPSTAALIACAFGLACAHRRRYVTSRGQG